MHHEEVDRRKTTDLRNQGKIHQIVRLSATDIAMEKVAALYHYHPHKMSGVNLLFPSKYC